MLILALFASDSEVGIYSLASTIVEGFVQALIVLRALFAPSLIAALEFAPASEKARVVMKTLGVSYVLAIAATVVALIGFPFFLSWSGLDRNFSGSFPIFAVLQIGTTLAAGYIVLGTILMMETAGRPKPLCYGGHRHQHMRQYSPLRRPMARLGRPSRRPARPC